MSCSTWREAISAIADGEAAGVDPDLVAAHRQRCPACDAFANDIHLLRRAYAVAEADLMPDLAPRVARLDRVADRLQRWGSIRVLLAVVAVQIIVLAAPRLVAGDGGDSLHGARHLGAFTVAYGAGLLLVVWRPARARSLLPVAATLGAALFITGVIDIVRGDVPLSGEILHVPELASVVLLWALTLTPRRRGASAPAVGGRRPELRTVRDASQDGTESETA